MIISTIENGYLLLNRQTGASPAINCIVLYYELEMNSSSQELVKARICDLIAFKRCLTSTEIQAIHQQQTSIERVKIGT
jgi:hypothetical protein